jgi:glycosyltransferase involved in cell wall biosynthesis
MFSLALPVRYHANFLPFALESVRAQCADIQVAVMDATPDQSVQKVLERYGDLLSYRRHGPDAGQASAIQEGWDHTDGDIVAWLCADDYYFPNALEAVESVFIGHPEVDVVYGDAVFVDEADQFIGYFPIGQFATSSECIGVPKRPAGHGQDSRKLAAMLRATLRRLRRSGLCRGFTTRT